MKTFKISLILLILSAILFPYSSSWGSKDDIIMDQDVFIFKVGSKIFSKKDLLHYYQSLSLYGCLNDKALLFEYVKSEINGDHVKHLNSKELKNFSLETKDYFSKLLKLAKLLMYSKSFDQEIDLAKLDKSLKSEACSKEKKELNKDFSLMLEIESLNRFLSARFLPASKDYTITKFDIEKAKKGVNSLVNSIQKQIDQEVYW